MTNKDKKEYFSLALAYSTAPYPNELLKWKEFHSKRPKTFYKYRQFDENTYKMLDQNYAYVTPAEKLDDPFDCLTNIDFEAAIDTKDNSISNEMINLIENIVFRYLPNSSFDKNELRKIMKDTSSNGQMDYDGFCEKIEKLGYLSNETMNLLRVMVANSERLIPEHTASKEFEELFKMLNNSKKTVGVCSLTTKRDNKVMWSLYGGCYKGYCVEYEDIKNDSVLKCLRPVMYTKKSDNDILKKVVEFELESLIRVFTGGQASTHIGVFDELLCTKDSDWKYQDEWRIVSAAGERAPMKARAVYLGFDVSEENELEMKECAKRNGFDLYKMKKPTGKKIIEYTKLELC